MKKSLLVFGISLVTASHSFGYGSQGHEGIAEFAHTHLNPATKSIIDDMLAHDSFVLSMKKQMQAGKSTVQHASTDGDNSAVQETNIPVDDMGKIAVWADDLKFLKKNMAAGNVLKSDPAVLAEANQFNLNFFNNGNWHFLNLPIGTDSFEEDTVFNPDSNNVVDAINGAIAVLEGGKSGYGTGKNNNAEFTKKEALRLIVHFVGDIHQPLHVGTGFYDIKTAAGTTIKVATNAILISEPSKILDNTGQKIVLQNDTGGNSVHTSDTNKALELHAHWDNILVENFANGSKSSHDLANKMTSKVGSQVASVDTFNTPGDYHSWAAAWATDSVKESKGVYDGLTFNSVTFDANGKIQSIQVDNLSGSSYDQNQAQRAEAQLEKAGAHLALLLNSIKIKWSSVDYAEDKAGQTSVPAVKKPRSPATPKPPRSPRTSRS